MRKRIFSLFLILTAVLLLSAPVQAADPELEQYIIDSCISGEDVDISAYALTEDELDALYWELSYGGRLPWYARDGYYYYYDEDTLRILEFSPDLLDMEAYDRAAYELRLQEVLQAAVCEGMTPVQQALAVHDYLAANFAYDDSLTYYTGYDLLVRGTAVCEGYTEAYMDLLNRLGIPCVMVISEEMDHSWNLVQIDGSWYHVDVTWDDPATDMYGQVYHDYFLLTDAELEADSAQCIAEGFPEDAHCGWETDILCNGPSLQGQFWTGVDSQIVWLDADNWFYRRYEDWDSHIWHYQPGTGEETLLYTDREEYIDLGLGEYAYYHLGLSLWDGKLYFASTDSVYSMNLDGSDVTEVYSHAPGESGSFLYGSFVTGDTLYLTLCDHDFGIAGTVTVALPPSDSHVHDYTQYITPATCTQSSTGRYSCSCGIHTEVELVPPSGHSYVSAEDTPPGLYREGRISYTCVYCGEVYYETTPGLSFMQWLISLLS